MARPRKYADDAARQAAYRTRYAVIQVRLVPETAETLTKLAEYLDVPRTEVANSLLNYALLNRNWIQLGLFGKRLPHAADKRAAKVEGEPEQNPIGLDLMRDFLLWAMTEGATKPKGK